MAILAIDVLNSFVRKEIEKEIRIFNVLIYSSPIYTNKNREFFSIE